MKHLSRFELLRMINHMKTPGGALFRAITIQGVAVWTFFQVGILDDLGRMATEGGVSSAQDRAVPFFKRVIRVMRVSISIVSSILFLVRWSLRRPTALILASDQAKQEGPVNARLVQVYRWLDAHHASFADVVHTTYDRSFVPNLMQRPKGALYLDALRLVARFVVRVGFGGKVSRYMASLDFSDFPQEQRAEIRAIVHKYYRLSLESAVVTRMLSVLLRIIRPKVFLTIDDVRNHNELLVASRMAGIPSVVFQHANFGYFTGTDSLPPEMYAFGDRFVVWNRYWADQLPLMSAQFALHRDRILIGGRANAALPPAHKIHPPRNQKPQRILVPCEASVPPAIARRCMDAIRMCPDVIVLFSLRAGGDVSEQLDRYGLFADHPGVEVGSSFDLANIDAGIGMYSTFLDDLVAMGLPVGVMHVGYESFEDLSACGLAASLTPENIRDELPALTGLSVEERERRRGVLIDGWGHLDTVLSHFL